MRVHYGYQWLALLLLGWPVAFVLVNQLAFALPVVSLSEAIWFFVLMPLLETLILNRLLQQELTIWLAKATCWSLRRRQSLLLILIASLFMFMHWQIAGSWLVLWWIPGVLLAYVWQLSQSVLLVASLHASWNISLWLCT